MLRLSGGHAEFRRSFSAARLSVEAARRCANSPANDHMIDPPIDGLKSGTPFPGFSASAKAETCSREFQVPRDFKSHRPAAAGNAPSSRARPPT
jgi:hypothetical protein